jgi:hypothetical protein
MIIEGEFLLTKQGDASDHHLINKIEAAATKDQ